MRLTGRFGGYRADISVLVAPVQNNVLNAFETVGGYSRHMSRVRETPAAGDVRCVTVPRSAGWHRAVRACHWREADVTGVCLAFDDRTA